MASLKLEHIYKVYPNGTKAVNDISLDIKNGEFIVFVGPSGCGKSTTLRMIAGLEDISSGELYIDNDIVNDVEPKDRDIAMVFQNYALYPHMSVYENMAFGLRLRHVPEDVIQEKVLWASDILGLREYLDRKPRAMSGGQRQRVALGRAILRDPKVMLLDEPLSNLDAKLRTQMRSEIAKLHQKLKTTFIYVTHDQTEAMTLGDRVVVMKKGTIQQVDTPKNLYHFPANQFVASFIGTPQMNFFDVTLLKEGEKVRIHFIKENLDLYSDSSLFVKVLPSYLDGKKTVVFGIRCENVRISKNEDMALPVKVSHFEELGSESLIYGNLSSEEGENIILKENEISSLKPEDVISVSFDMTKAYFFDKETQDSILSSIPAYNSLPCMINGNSFTLFDRVFTLPFIKENKASEAEIQIPCDAFLFKKDGIPCSVIKEEEVQNKRLLHLDVCGKTLFALKEDDTDISSFDLDISKITLKTKDKEILYKPMEEYDSYSFYFYNYPTIMKEENNPLFASVLKERISNVEKEYQDKLIEVENEYQKKKDEIALNPSSFEEKEKEYLSVKEKNTKKMKEILSSKKEEERKLKEEYEKERRKAKEENDRIFLEKKKKEEKEYQDFNRTNQDKEALKRRTDEYHIFKDSYPTEKENSLSRSLKTLSLNYESSLSSLKATSKRNILLLRKEIEEKKKESAIAKDPLSSLKKKHDEKVRLLNDDKKQALIKANCLFFIKLANGYTLVCEDKISNKLIQGLSSRVFEKEFILDIRHDAYTLVKDGGFQAKAEEILTISGQNYIKCSYSLPSSEKRCFIMKSEEKIKEGEMLHVTFDLKDARITLKDMNIRLY